MFQSQPSALPMTVECWSSGSMNLSLSSSAEPCPWKHSGEGKATGNAWKKVHSACALQWWSSLWTPLCVLAAGEKLLSGAHHHPKYTASSASRIKTEMVKLYLHPSSYLCVRILFKVYKVFCISYFILIVVCRLYYQVICVRF